MKRLVSSSRNDYITLNVYDLGHGSGYKAESWILGEEYNPDMVFDTVRDAHSCVFQVYRRRLATRLGRVSFQVI